MDAINRKGLLLLGCGRMGSAMLAGWLARGVDPAAVWVQEPTPSQWLRAAGVRLNAGVPPAPAVAVVAVKPQMMGAALPALRDRGDDSMLVLSVAAGTPIAAFETALGAQTPVVRAMPNTPAAVGRAITAIVGNARAGAEGLALAEALMAAIGQVVRLDAESQMDAVTAVSGSGPAYVFHLIETLAAAAEAEGLPPALALHLARATVAGAGALAEASSAGPAQLRIDVTSPGGTTAAALAVLMDAQSGFPALLSRAVAAAAARSRELGK